MQTSMAVSGECLLGAKYPGHRLISGYLAPSCRRGSYGNINSAVKPPQRQLPAARAGIFHVKEAAHHTSTRATAWNAEVGTLFGTPLRVPGAGSVRRHSEAVQSLGCHGQEGDCTAGRAWALCPTADSSTAHGSPEKAVGLPGSPLGPPGTALTGGCSWASSDLGEITSAGCRPTRASLRPSSVPRH